MKTQIQREDIYNNWTIYSMTGKAAQGRCIVHFISISTCSIKLSIKIQIQYKCWSQTVSTPGCSWMEIWDNWSSSRKRGGVSHSEVLQTQNQTFPAVAKSLSNVLWNKQNANN